MGDGGSSRGRDLIAPGRSVDFGTDRTRGPLGELANYVAKQRDMGRSWQTIAKLTGRNASDLKSLFGGGA